MDQVTWFCTKLGQVTWICKILDQVTWSAQFAQVQITWFLEFEGQVTWFRKIVDQVTWQTKCEDQITSTTILQKWTRLPGRPDYLVAAKSGPDYLVAASWAQGDGLWETSLFLAALAPPEQVSRGVARSSWRLGRPRRRRSRAARCGSAGGQGGVAQHQLPMPCSAVMHTAPSSLTGPNARILRAHEKVSSCSESGSARPSGRACMSVWRRLMQSGKQSTNRGKSSRKSRRGFVRCDAYAAAAVSHRRDVTH